MKNELNEIIETKIKTEYNFGKYQDPEIDKSYNHLLEYAMFFSQFTRFLCVFSTSLPFDSHHRCNPVFCVPGW